MIKHSKLPRSWRFAGRAAVALMAVVMISQTTEAQEPKKMYEVEGITEYRLDNGVKLLLFPDNSKPQFTMNMTVNVGSRHEGYGESGMAHLLEHMLFRGTDRHPDIPELLKNRGVLNMNGTTSIDRTNYFETLPAPDGDPKVANENLKFAIEMESDRLINSWIKPEHLEKEMTIVRSEFERGENNPQGILIQRIMTAAFQWHNYGKSTIGNRSDIMRVPATNLRVFYRKYYQPDNITLVIAGKFDKQLALDLVEKNFGSIPRPERELPKTYTEEPAQDGERTVILRRSGDVQFVGLGYHIPSASSTEYASAQVLARVLSNQPSGPLYKALVETKMATSAGAFARIGYDPGIMLAYAEVPVEKDLVKAKNILVEQMETIGSSGVSDEDVKRAVVAISKGREQQFANTERFATALSEWESYGDWRLYFLHRDRLEAVTKDDVQNFAKRYMIQSNRTVGLFFPSEETERIAIDAQNNVKKMVANYKGREAMAAGEAFNPSPMNIQKRTTFGQLNSGMKYALLPKETRGDRVTLSGTIHYGDENSLKGKRAAADLLPQLLSRGTKELGFQEYQDALNNLKASLGFSGSLGTLNFNLQTERKNLVPALAIMRQALREPKLDPSDMEIIQSEMVTGIESGMSDPMSLAVNEFSRRMDPQPADNVRYTPTMKEEVKNLKDVSIDDVRNLQEKFLNGEFGEIAVVGDFDPTTTLAELNRVFDGWKTEMPYQRIEEPANLDIKAERINLDTPDKANAIYIAGVATDINENHPDYEAMLIGNYIMGGGPLSSRIADRVRKKDGLSYTAMTRFQADDQDERGMYMMFCISNPMNTEKVVETVQEEVDRMLESGVTGDELQKAKESFLINRRGSRARDGQLASELLSNMKTGRTMEFQNASDEKISTLTKEQVDAAMKKVIAPDRLLIITAGDFKKAKSEAGNK